MMTLQMWRRAALVCAVMGTLAGCGGGNGDGTSAQTNATDSTNSDDDTGTGVASIQIDATAGGIGAPADDPDNKYTYFSFETGEILDLTDAEAEGSTDWHIAFKRSNTKLNGGVSGPGTVTGAVADAQEDFYDAGGDPNLSVFLNVSAETELEAFEAVDSIDGLSFVSDREIPAITGDGSSDGWWLYNPATFSVSPNPDKWWLVRSAEGDSYAKFHVTGIVQESRDITLELFIQGDGDSAFSGTPTTYTAAIGAAGGQKCYDIDAETEVDCTAASDAWDLMVEVSTDGRGWNIWTNGGISGAGSGASFGPIEDADIGDYVSGTMTTGGFNIAALYSTDSAGGLFADANWWDYNLEGNNRLWPNYRVYAIDTGDGQYKLQVLSYYDEAGVSGVISLRFSEI